MLEAVGDILNWAAAGVLFPLMLLPLAALFSEKRLASSAIWLGLVAMLVVAGALFRLGSPSCLPCGYRRLTTAPLFFWRSQR